MNLKTQEIYQFRFWLNRISPLIWRRFLVNAKNTTIADLHHLIQLSMHWEDFHLHQLTIQGKTYGISYDSGMCFRDNPYNINLIDLHLREKERFFYQYNFHIPWEVEIRLEKMVLITLKRFYPVCIGGNNVAPSENYNNHIDFMANKDTKFINGKDSLIEDLIKIQKKRSTSIEIIKDKIIEIINWINKCKFNRKNLNDQLKQYAKGLVSLEDLIEEGDYDDEIALHYF